MSQSSDILVPLRELSQLLLQFRAKLYDTLDLIVLSLVLFVLLNLLLYYLIHKVATDEGHEGKFRLFRRTKLPEKISRTLIVTAHPGELDKFRKCIQALISCVICFYSNPFGRWRVHVLRSDTDSAEETPELQNVSPMFI